MSASAFDAAMADALSKHPDCSYADWDNGMTAFLELTIVVKLWRNEECYLHDDPPKHTVSYPRTFCSPTTEGETDAG